MQSKAIARGVDIVVIIDQSHHIHMMEQVSGGLSSVDHEGGKKGGQAGGGQLDCLLQLQPPWFEQLHGGGGAGLLPQPQPPW